MLSPSSWPLQHSLAVFFFVSALTTSLANSVRRSIRPFFLAPSPLAPYKPLYDVLTWFTSLTFLNYFASSFQLLDFQVAIKTWATVNFVPHAIVVGGIVIFKMGLERYFQNVQRHWGLLKDKPKTRVGEGKVEEKKEDKEAAKEAKVEKEAAEDVEHKENGKTSPATPSRRSLVRSR